MGTLRSLTNVQGMTVNGVLLGDPVELDGDPATFEYDDSAFPAGTVEVVDGALVVVVDADPLEVEL